MFGTHLCIEDVGDMGKEPAGTCIPHRVDHRLFNISIRNDLPFDLQRFYDTACYRDCGRRRHGPISNTNEQHQGGTVFIYTVSSHTGYSIRCVGFDSVQIITIP